MQQNRSLPTYEEFTRVAPGVSAALRALTVAVDDSGLEKSLTELVKVRVSQLNGCAFCLQFHLDLARRQGVAGRKLDLVSAWGDERAFSARERAALRWAETLTVLGAVAGAGADRARDEAAAEAQAQFDLKELAHLTAAIASIQAWNRIVIGFRFPPPGSAA
jgi:AhpD family alkylhydroperoxidase